MAKQPKKFMSVDQSDYDKTVVKPITLRMQKGLWLMFKDLVPRRKKLNEMIVELIQKYIMDNTENDDDFDSARFMKEQDWYAKEKKKLKKS